MFGRLELGSFGARAGSTIGRAFGLANSFVRGLRHVASSAVSRRIAIDTFGSMRCGKISTIWEGGRRVAGTPLKDVAEVFGSD